MGRRRSSDESPLPAVSSDVQNLVELDDLSDLTILAAVTHRFKEDRIYTYVGDMLLALNPYKPLGLYGAGARTLHLPDRAVPATPHVYAMAQRAYKNLTAHNRDQCCLISGESGAGKTETAKFFLGQLLHYEQDATYLQRRILESLPLLEAFGNAKTKLNDNSSRFGKYIEVMYSSGRVCGAKISHYLLEKARVVARDEGEASYHVFYYLLTGAPGWIREGLSLMDEKDYNYLHPGGHLLSAESAAARAREERRRSSKYEFAGADMVSDVVKYEELIECLNILDFDEEELGHVHAVLMTVLVLGNVDFTPDEADESASVVRSSGPMMHVGLLCGVNPREFSVRLTHNTLHVRGETLLTPRTVEAARTTRDSLAQHIYDQLFRWIVLRVNQNIWPRSEGSTDPANLRGIGVLDIFGFEDFGYNSFDQLCINTANEQLQFYFNQCIFQWELREYKKEGISESDVTFVDNQPQVSLLLARPGGLYALLDEACLFPRSTDATCADKFAQAFKKSPHFRRDRLKPEVFGVVHYAGCVWYTTQGILERNRNTQLYEFSQLMLRSPVVLFRKLFTVGTLRSSSGRKSKRKKAERGGTWRLRGILKDKKEVESTTLGGMFLESLRDLMRKVEASEPLFVRCIKPNMDKEPQRVERPFVAQQLAYAGVMETTRIRREGFAVRVKFAEFVSTYKLLAFEATDTRVKGTINDCTTILKAVGLSGWRLGRTKVFLKYHHSTALVERMGHLHHAANVIGRAHRQHAARRERARLRARREAEQQEQRRAAEAEQRRRTAEAEAELAAAEERAARAREATAARLAQEPPLIPDLPPPVSPPPLANPSVSTHSFPPSPVRLSTVEEDATTVPTPPGRKLARQGSVTIIGGEADAAEGNRAEIASEAAPVKGADPKIPKLGTVTKGNVGAAKAMFMAMMAEDTGASRPPKGKFRRESAQPSFNVKSKAKALKIQFPPMAGGDLSHGPALPWAKPFRMPATRIDEEGGGSGGKEALNAFLAELSMQRLYSALCDQAGICEPADFLLFQPNELTSLGFKPAHAKKLVAAAEKAPSHDW